jgi:type III secretion protein T
MPIKSCLALLVLVLYANTLFEYGRETIDDMAQVLPLLQGQWQ